MAHRDFATNPLRRRTAGRLLAAVALGIGVAVATSSGVHAAGPGTLPSSVKLEQWKTKPQGGWTTGALNHNNSDYFEGEVVPFRLTIPSKVGAGSYQFSVCRNYDNGARRGYLYHAPFNTDRAADPGGTIGSTQDGFSAVNATLDSVTDVGGRGACKAGDREAIVVITKSGGTSYVLWGGHLASPADPGVGEGNSAAYWPGASLHMKLSTPSKDVAIQTCTSGATATPAITPSWTPTAAHTATAIVTATVAVTVTQPPAEPSQTPAPPATNTPSTEPTTTPQPATATATPTPTGTVTPTPTEETPPKHATNTPTVAATATASAAAATATPTRVSQQAGVGAQPRQLPATGTCGDSSSGSSTWLPLLVSGLAAALLGAAGTLWFVRRKPATLP